MIKVEARVTPKANSLKRKVNLFEHKDIINFNRKVYEIHYNELRNLALDYREGVEEICRENGLIKPSLFEGHCLLCEYSPHNVSTFIRSASGKSGEVTVIEENADRNPLCNYVAFDITVARVFQHEKGGPKFYALKFPCVFYDSMVHYLAGKGLLEPYKTDREFNFKSIMEFERGRANPKNFAIKRQPLRELGRLVTDFFIELSIMKNELDRY